MYEFIKDFHVLNVIKDFKDVHAPQENIVIEVFEVFKIVKFMKLAKVFESFTNAL